MSKELFVTFYSYLPKFVIFVSIDTKYGVLFGFGFELIKREPWNKVIDKF